MQKKSYPYQMNGFTIDIANPDKVLIAGAGLTKSDFIEYYLSVETPLMAYGKGRPLSMKRYPDGVPGHSFFQRNKPVWAPAWVKSQALGVGKKADYILLENIKTIIWLLNLDTVEFHAAQVSAPHFEKPDMLVFDLDPPPDTPFPLVRDFALAIRPEIESFGYKTFVKTSGKKGIHIHCPIFPKWTFDEVFAAAKEVGEHIAARFKDCTLNIKKEKRKDKILLDIYRNHAYQSVVLPYSIRATERANVAMPLSWEELEKTASPNGFTLLTVPEIVQHRKDPWAAMKAGAVALHNV